MSHGLGCVVETVVKVQGERDEKGTRVVAIGEDREKEKVSRS